MVITIITVVSCIITMTGVSKASKQQNLQLAKDFLNEFPTERIACAAAHHIPETTLYSSITRAKEPPQKHGGQNKVLTPKMI